MATMKLSLVLVLLLACTVSFHGVLADIICENLPTNVCAFSVSSSGKRCVLENSIKDGGKVEYQCKTSEVMVGSNTAEYLETDKCVSACGVDRKSVGMSSDTLLEPTFIAKLCSPACYNNCPNIVDLYFNLAAGEGVYLPDLCQKQQASLRRDMVELQSVEAPIADILSADVDVLNVDVVDAPSAGAPIADILAADVLTVDVVDVVDAPPSADAPVTEILDAEVLTGDFVDLPIADAPAQLRNARRAMVELLSSGSAEAPVADDDASTIDTPAPSPTYF